MKTIRPFPLGERLPPSRHAVTCSLPTLADVIGYEEKRPAVMERLESGYPRFLTHFLIRQIAAWYRERFLWPEKEVFLFASEQSATAFQRFCGDRADGLEIRGDAGFGIVACSPQSPACELAKAFLQHTGCGISSRRAEDFLIAHGLLDRADEEEVVSAGVDATIERELSMAFGGASPENIVLASSGMNAFYATFRALDQTQRESGRDIWIQFGWLYVDTIEVLRKFTGSSARRYFHSNVFDLDGLEAFLNENGKRVAGLVTEMPTNPKIETPDAERLRHLADAHGFPLIIDPTLASPYNIDVLSLADVVVNSLTKYAASAGDVLAGAAVINPASRWAAGLGSQLRALREPLYQRDAARLALELRSYRDVIRNINANTEALVSHLEKHPRVKRVLWAREAKSAENYDRIAAREGGPGGILTIELNGGLADFYDALPIMKGPSFGTVFTIACPFMYLAHYDMVVSEEGRRALRAEGIDPDLVRISVGTEPIDEIIAAFEEALGTIR